MCIYIIYYTHNICINVSSSFHSCLLDSGAPPVIKTKDCDKSSENQEIIRKKTFCLPIFFFWASRALHQVSGARRQLYHLHESAQHVAIRGFLHGSFVGASEREVPTPSEACIYCWSKGIQLSGSHGRLQPRAIRTAPAREAAVLTSAAFLSFLKATGQGKNHGYNHVL